MPSQVFEKSKRLKYFVELISSRNDLDDSRPYIGLENIESFTGRLAENPNDKDQHDPTSTEKGDFQSNLFESDDVLFGKLRPYLAKVWIASFSGQCSTELLVMRPTKVDPRFLRYTCLSPQFIDSVNASTFGSKMPRADWDFIGNMPIPDLSMSAQRVIANFLDRETVKLDALVAAKERIVGLLTEKRMALIAQAITRGFDPHAPLRDSGIFWLRNIPAHWQTKRVKYLFRLITDPAPENNDFELLSLYTDIGVKPRRELEARGNKSVTTDGYWLVRRGDLVVNKLLAWMGAFGVSDYDGVTSPAYDILRPSTTINSHYYHHLFRCGICLPEIKRRSYGIMDMRLRLYFDRFGDMIVPVPPREEQAKIVDKLSEQTQKLDRVVDATQRTIALLKERRAALISAAVTGQINVEDVA